MLDVLPDHVRAFVHGLQAQSSGAHWWRRATVTASGDVSFYDDDGSNWLTENGL
jgi:hypothetical protein